MQHVRRGWALLACAATLTALAAQADEKADALLQKAREASAGAKTLQADLVYEVQSDDAKGGYSGAVRLMKPNYAYFKTSNLPNRQVSILSDGKNRYQVMEAQKQYLRGAIQPGGQNVGIGGPYSPVTGFFDLTGNAAGGERKYVGKETLEGREYEVVEITGGPRPEQVRRFYVGPSGLVEGAVVTLGNSEMQRTYRTWLKNVKLDQPMKAEEFAFAPPEGFRPYEPPNFEKNLLAVGKEAPDFNLPQPEGNRLSLSDTVKEKKAVLINFWFYG